MARGGKWCRMNQEKNSEFCGKKFTIIQNCSLHSLATVGARDAAGPSRYGGQLAGVLDASAAGSSGLPCFLLSHGLIQNSTYIHLQPVLLKDLYLEQISSAGDFACTKFSRA